jgi:hypothetical protein
VRILSILLVAAWPALCWALGGGGKLNFDAYSIDAPLERGWHLARRGTDDVAYSATLTRSHTWMLTAAAFSLDAPIADGRALLAHEQAEFLSDSDPRRFRIVESEGSVQSLRGATCARLFYKAEDRLTGGEGAFYVIEVMQVTCVHPRAPRLAVVVSYHARYLPGESAAALAAFGERFIRSVRFWRPIVETTAANGR